MSGYSEVRFVDKKQAALTLTELCTSSSQTTASPGCGRHDMSPRFASYPELKSKADGRLWKRAIQRSSSSAYHELPESSLDPPEPTKGKLPRALSLPFGVFFSTASVRSISVQAGRCRLRRMAISCKKIKKINERLVCRWEADL